MKNHVKTNEKTFGSPTQLGDRILYEDNHLLCVNKACSELVQGDKTGDSSLLEDLKGYIRIRDGKPGNVFLGVVHRLDRPTSGCVLYAKTSKALSRLTRAFRDREVTKMYWGITEKAALQTLGEQGVMRDWLRRNPKTNKSTAVPPGTTSAKEALLGYRLLHSFERYVLWQVELQTGRHHQIRVQFASRGFPLRGDLKYGADRSLPGGGIALHARSITCSHPTQDGEIHILADPRQVQNDSLWAQLAEMLENPTGG
jgi:23S rRNA pseudouridine1911/1915/1917 synthase